MEPRAESPRTPDLPSLLNTQKRRAFAILPYRTDTGLVFVYYEAQAIFFPGAIARALAQLYPALVPGFVGIRVSRSRKN